MAHFAEIELKTDPTGFTTDQKWIVKRVVVIGNDVPAGLTTLGQNDMHPDGESYCKKLFKGGEWKQTSYNNNFRKQYAGIGYRYDSTKDKFLSPQPFASWSLDSNDDWQAPITYPTITNDGADPSVWIYIIRWNEDKYNSDNTKGWTATKSDDTAETPTVYDWNGTAWVSA